MERVRRARRRLLLSNRERNFARFLRGRGVATHFNDAHLAHDALSATRPCAIGASFFLTNRRSQFCDRPIRILFRRGGHAAPPAEVKIPPGPTLTAGHPSGD